jgi:hypothetical protein
MTNQSDTPLVTVYQNFFGMTEPEMSPLFLASYRGLWLHW